MGTAIAFLRGINVGGHNRMKMAELRDVFSSLGYADVRTYIQSGNVVFESPETDEEPLRSAIERAIDDAFGYDVTVMVRTREALESVVADAPFDGPAGDGVKRYVTFLNEVPGEAGAATLEAAQSDAEAFNLCDREVYSELDKDALGDGRFTDAGKTLGIAATRRNWEVVQAVLELATQ